MSGTREAEVSAGAPRGEEKFHLNLSATERAKGGVVNWTGREKERNRGWGKARKHQAAPKGKSEKKRTRGGCCNQGAFRSI